MIFLSSKKWIIFVPYRPLVTLSLALTITKSFFLSTCFITNLQYYNHNNTRRYCRNLANIRAERSYDCVYFAKVPFEMKLTLFTHDTWGIRLIWLLFIGAKYKPLKGCFWVTLKILGKIFKNCILHKDVLKNAMRFLITGLLLIS